MKLLNRDTRFWPIDKLDSGVFRLHGRVLSCVVEYDSPTRPRFLPGTLSGSAVAGLRGQAAQSPPAWLFRNWYPLLYVASCYKEMANVFPLVRGVNFDQPLSDLDQRIWGLQPGVWLASIQTPVLTEFLQWIYTLLFPQYC